MMLMVIREMASLAPRAQIVVRAVLRRVIEMRYREDDLCRSSDSVVGDAAVLALVVGAREYFSADRLPVGRIPSGVLRFDWHSASALTHGNC